MSIIRGTTPTIEFVLPFGTDYLVEGFVTICQRGKVVIDKPLAACRCDENKLTVKLTQAETLALACNCDVEIQIRARTADGEAVASDIMHESAARILKDGVI